MTSLPKFNLALVLLYCALSAVGCRARGRSEPRAQVAPEPSAGPIQSAESTSVVDAPKPPTYGWSAISFALSYKSTIAAFTKTGIRTSAEGRLEIASLTGDDKTKVFRLSSAHAGAEAFGRVAWRVPIEELETPFYVILDAFGAVRELAIAPGASLETRGLFDAIATTTQVVRSPRIAAKWETVESDGSGTYRAAYSAKSKDIWEKRKTSYVVPDSASGPSIPTKIGESATLIGFDAAGRISSIKGKETLASQLLRGKSEVAIELSDPRPIHSASHEPVPNVPSGYVRYAAGAAGRRTPAERDEQLAQSVVPREIASQLAATDSPGGRAKLRERLAAKVRITPSVAQELGSMVRNGDRASRDLIGALSEVGNVAAQLELVGLAGDARLPAEARETAAIAMSSVTNPTREYFDAALQLYERTDESLGRVIGLSCGGIVRSFKGTAPDVERIFVREIEHLWRTMATSRSRENLFLMLANAATLEALPMLQHVLRDGPTAERVLALQAMRNMDPAKVVPIARQVMAMDHDESVRAAALEIAKKSAGPEPSAALAQVVRADKAKAVRQAAER